MIEEYECDPSPAILLRYSGDDWQDALDRYYSENPGSFGQVFIVLMPSNGRFKLNQERG